MSYPPFEDRPTDPLFDFDFDQVVRDARSNRLGAGLSLVGWFHLLLFGSCEVLYGQGDRAALHFIPLWFLDVVFTLLVLHHRLPSIGSPGSARSFRVAFRIWITYTILCLTSASLNSITGFQVDWFKVSWAMLATSSFATMAWIFHPGFLIPAVQMSITALLIASHPDHAYAIFGVSWFLTFQGFGVLLERNRLNPPFFRGAKRRVDVVRRRESQEV